MELAKKEVVIASGLARGIDRKAHEGVLEVGGKTIAVLGNGLLVVYPKEHRSLYEKIPSSGALLSEFPLLEGPQKHYFPRRNRVISGLSQGVLVVEAPQKSGALITAKFALEEGREVFAVPGRIHSPCSLGTHHLLKQGAKLVTEPSDILEELNFTFSKDILTEKIDFGQSLDHREREIFSILEDTYPFSTLLEKVGCHADELSQLLLSLEIKGLVQHHQGTYYRRVSCQPHSSL